MTILYNKLLQQSEKQQKENILRNTHENFMNFKKIIVISCWFHK